jgi:hypothetical protein
VTPDDLRQALDPCIGTKLASDLVAEFLQIRQDTSAGALGGTSPGKFVETMVQSLQTIAGRAPDPDGAVHVEPFLQDCESGRAALNDDLRITAARVLRGMQAIRSRRSIVHKGQIDANAYDLRLLYHQAQWLVAELLRHCSGWDMATAGRLVEYVQMPVGELVETFDADRLLLSTSATASEELLMVLRTYYPERVSRAQIGRDVRRAAGTVTRVIQAGVGDRTVHGDAKGGYKLTSKGLSRASAIAARLSESDAS